MAYFHIECINERKEAAEKAATSRVFRPDVTQVKDSTMPFCSGDSMDLYIGISYILNSWAPCAVVKLAAFLDPVTVSNADTTEFHNVTIHDARKERIGSFHETGFTLVELDAEPLTTDWRTSVMMDKNADILKFHKLMEPHIKRLYPDTKRMKWTYNVVRGGEKFMDQPKAVAAPHLDYHQNATARVLFHKEFPVLPGSEPALLMGEEDDEHSKLGVMLGERKPIHPAAVCDHPLAVMDSRTFSPEHQALNKLHLNFGFLTFHNLNGAIKYSPKQKWFYYPFQTTREVLIFHQYTKDRFFSNPHTSFLNMNCPEGSESRISVEMRLALYF